MKTIARNSYPCVAIAAVIVEGCIQIAPGVHLSTRENIEADQADWMQEGDKVHDFSKAPYWMTTNDGQVHPIDGPDDDDLIEAMKA